jgi:hypothetical protein
MFAKEEEVVNVGDIGGVRREFVCRRWLADQQATAWQDRRGRYCLGENVKALPVTRLHFKMADVTLCSTSYGLVPFPRCSLVSRVQRSLSATLDI